MKCSLLTLSSYLDEELEPVQRAEVDAHLVGCDRCRNGLDYLREEVSRISDLSRVHLPDAAATAFLTQLGLLGPDDDAPPRPPGRATPPPGDAPPWLSGHPSGGALPWQSRSRPDPRMGTPPPPPPPPPPPLGAARPPLVTAPGMETEYQLSGRAMASKLTGLSPAPAGDSGRPPQPPAGWRSPARAASLERQASPATLPVPSREAPVRPAAQADHQALPLVERESSREVEPETPPRGPRAIPTLFGADTDDPWNWAPRDDPLPASGGERPRPAGTMGPDSDPDLDVEPLAQPLLDPASEPPRPLRPSLLGRLRDQISLRLTLMRAGWRGDNIEAADREIDGTPAPLLGELHTLPRPRPPLHAEPGAATESAPRSSGPGPARPELEPSEGPVHRGGGSARLTGIAQPRPTPPTRDLSPYWDPDSFGARRVGPSHTPAPSRPAESVGPLLAAIHARPEPEPDQAAPAGLPRTPTVAEELPGPSRWDAASESGRSSDAGEPVPGRHTRALSSRRPPWAPGGGLARLAGGLGDLPGELRRGVRRLRPRGVAAVSGAVMLLIIIVLVAHAGTSGPAASLQPSPLSSTGPLASPGSHPRVSLQPTAAASVSPAATPTAAATPTPTPAPTATSTPASSSAETLGGAGTGWQITDVTCCYVQAGSGYTRVIFYLAGTSAQAPAVAVAYPTSASMTLTFRGATAPAGFSSASGGVITAMTPPSGSGSTFSFSFSRSAQVKGWDFLPHGDASTSSALLYVDLG